MSSLTIRSPSLLTSNMVFYELQQRWMKHRNVNENIEENIFLLASEIKQKAINI